MNTYQLVKDIIFAKNFKLQDLQNKIKKSWLMGDLTDEEYNELYLMATDNVKIENERPDWLTTASKLSERISALEAKIGADNTQTGTEEDVEIWITWDGISNKYQYGAVVSHSGIIYESIFNGQNVWEPGTAGTEALWKIKE